MAVDRNGPLLMEGPVEVTTPEGDVVVSERFVVAICTCCRSRTYPWCDTSHRRRGPAPAAGASGPSPGCAEDAGETVARGAGGADATAKGIES